MSNTINSISPNLRDFLLMKNLITDSIVDNGLTTLLNGIGYPVIAEELPITVLPSNDIVDDGLIYKDQLIGYNKFKGEEEEYSQVNIHEVILPTSTPIIYSAYFQKNNLLIKSDEDRIKSTNTNLYVDVSKQDVIDITKTQSITTENKGSYLDENNHLNVGGPATGIINVLGSVIMGQGVGFSPTGIEPNFDIRTSLAGRALGAIGGINDTRLGQLGARYLALALANNAAFGLQQETIGHINTNPLSILMGNDIIIPNYDITVPSGKLGKVIDFGAKVLGFESPLSLFENSSSIFSYENSVSNILRANAQIKNTGRGQVLALFANINANLNSQFIGRRSGYAPGFKDERKPNEGVTPNIYAFGDGQGGIIDFLNNNISVDVNRDNSSTPDEFDPNSPISQSNYNLDGLIKNSGFDEDYYDKPILAINPNKGAYNDGFIWGDTKWNKNEARDFIGKLDGDELFTEKKSLLTKTKDLFKSNRMRILTTGKAIEQEKTQINSAVAGKEGSSYMSKGSGVLAFNPDGSQVTDLDNMFCRTWTSLDRYNTVGDLQKHSGVTNTMWNPEKNGLVDSVLDDNGFVKIAPYNTDFGSDGKSLKGKDDEITNVRNYMFSIENLAWNDSIKNLLQCEQGPGDLQSGIRGRIMWFPPYDLTVSENTSVSWESTNFIGRGEPIYTYNNTERTGTLQFKIIVDHPSFLNDNSLKKESNDYIASFFAGCIDIPSVLAHKLTIDEKANIEKDNTLKPQQKNISKQTPPSSFNIYFPNDSSSVEVGYEDGLDKDGNPISVDNQTGQGCGLDTTVGRNGVYFPDNTDFGLNKTYIAALVTGTTLMTDLIEKCPACKVIVTGYASKQGTTSANQELSEARVNTIRNLFIQNFKSFNIPDNIIEKRVPKGIVGGETGTGCSKDDSQDKLSCKEARKVTVVFEFDSVIDSDLNGIKSDPVNVPDKYKRANSTILNRFYSEATYFAKLKNEDSFVYDQIKDKIKFFHPAFHSITPEGFNSRLTFLQQCTRQGETKILDKPDNLAFGRPPVCILRLGDFYHTKIIIDSVGISYDPLVWDLNPEGIGVQPMIATIDLSFKMIGGQSLKGPINKLQNAVSFNFFGNTQVYDKRSDILEKSTDEKGNIQRNDKGNIIWDIKVGEQNIDAEDLKDRLKESELINGSRLATGTLDDEKYAENINGSESREQNQIG